jgi:hypothetical protein
VFVALGIQNAMRMLHIVNCGLPLSKVVFHIFSLFGAEGCVSDLRATAAPHHTDNLKTKAPNTTGSNHLYNTLDDGHNGA